MEWGVKPGERVMLWSENRWEWIVADLAIQAVAGVSVPVHASLTARQVSQLAEHCSARLALVSCQAMASRLRQDQHPNSELRRIVVFESIEPSPEVDFESLGID